MSHGPKTLGDAYQGGHLLVAICRHKECRYQREVALDRLVAHLGTRPKLLPDRGLPHFSDQMRCPSCKRMGMYLWLEAHRPSVVPPKLANCEIIDHGAAPYLAFGVIATAENLIVARGAYVAAALMYEEHRITLQQGAFVVADSKRDGELLVKTADDYRQMRAAEKYLSDPTKTKAS